MKNFYIKGAAAVFTDRVSKLVAVTSRVGHMIPPALIHITICYSDIHFPRRTMSYTIKFSHDYTACFRATAHSSQDL